MFRIGVLALGCAAAACGGNDDDDAPPTDADHGMCGAELRFTGEHIDWDSGAAFCGVFDAQFTVRGTGTTDATAPNGRFDTCVPDQETTLVDIVPPATMSACNGQTDTYVLPGLAVVRRSVLARGGGWSSRSFTPTQQAAAQGRAHVYVHL